MIINRSNLTEEKIAKLIKFCKPRGLDLKSINIYFKNCKSPYSCDMTFGLWEPPKIILRFGHCENFPLSFKLRSDKVARTGYLGNYEFNSKNEMMIFNLSHELRHAFQHQHETMKFWLYHNKKLAETDADTYAFGRLEKYRKLKKLGEDPLN